MAALTQSSDAFLLMANSSSTNVTIASSRPTQLNYDRKPNLKACVTGP